LRVAGCGLRVRGWGLGVGGWGLRVAVCGVTLRCDTTPHGRLSCSDRRSMGSISSAQVVGALPARVSAGEGQVGSRGDGFRA
jgi:hypothetical protein